MSEPAEAAGTEFWADADEGEALARYRTLVNAIDDGIYQLDADGRFVAVNDVVAETTGYDRERLLGEHVSVLLDADDVAAIEREIDRRLSGTDERRGTFEFDVRTADGDRVPCELRLNLLVEDGAFRGTLGVVRDVTDRRRTERELRERERQLERERDLTDEILEASPVGVVVRDGDGAVARTNERARELFGVDEGASDEGAGDEGAGEVSAGEGLAFDEDGLPIFDEVGRPVPADDRPSARALATGEAAYDRVLRVERPDDESRWLSVNAAPISADGDGSRRVVTTYEDVTEMKRRERELADELDEMFGRFTDAFYALDTDWRFTHVNDRAEELVDYRGEGLVGKEFWEVFEWATDSKLGEEYRTAMETQEPTAFEFYYPEPLAAWYEVHAYPSETGLSVYFRDVTERKERERALEESERRYRTLVEHFPNGAVALVDEDLRYRTVGGDPIDDHVGADDLEGRSVRDVLEPELAETFAPRYAAALGGESSAFETEFGGRSYQVHTVPVRDDDGDVFAALGLSQDVTEQVERERKLEETVAKLEETNERLESFASMLAHELRNPVTIGQIYSRQLSDEATPDAVEYVTEAFDRIEDMIDVMLILTRGRDAVGESGPLSLADAAQDAWEGVTAPAATLEVEIDEVLEADETYVRHLFQNLFENAVEHGSTSSRPQADDVDERSSSARETSSHDVHQTESDAAHQKSDTSEDAVEHGGPDVTVTVGELPTVSASSEGRGPSDHSSGQRPREDEASGGSEDEQSESSGVSPERREGGARREAKRTGGGFYVADDGDGIPPDDREAVFEPGFTTAADTGGTGLGLAFVAELADVYGWSVDATESEDGGARFEFTNVAFDADE